MILTILLSLWVMWILVNLVAMALVRPDRACFNGFRIHIPEDYRERLTPAEYLAVYAHEAGHRKYRHVWKNFLLVCFFVRPSQDRRWRQELEADDYAARCTHPLDLASFLRKMSFSAADNVRARRLEIMAFTYKAGA
jgi:hypothetical protein